MSRCFGAWAVLAAVAVVYVTATMHAPPHARGVVGRGQTFRGAGAAMTRSSAALMMLEVDAEVRTAIVDAFVNTARFTALRIPMGSSDFTAPIQQHRYSYDHTADDIADWTLVNFSIAEDLVVQLPQAIATVVNASAAHGRRVFTIAAPWSAPSWMKTSGSLNGGTLRSDDGANGTRIIATYAAYFARFVEAYAELGVVIDAVSLQNEPRNANDGYPTMVLSPWQEAQLALAIDAEFTARNLSTRVVVYDHNWDDALYPLQVYELLRAASPDGATLPARVLGAAFHCYAGDVTNQSVTHDAEPSLEVLFTECSGTYSSPDFTGDLLWDVQNLIVGATANWATTVLKWNAVLTQNGGPKLPGGCGNCRGVITVNTSAPSGARVTLNEDFYAIAHLSRFVPTGAQRVLLPSSVAGQALANQSVWFALPPDNDVVDGQVGAARYSGIVYNGGAASAVWTVPLDSFGFAPHDVTLTVPAMSVVTTVLVKPTAGQCEVVWFTTNSSARLLEDRATFLC
jgi:glucosylceramidase